jgi:hypothetical protein
MNPVIPNSIDIKLGVRDKYTATNVTPTQTIVAAANMMMMSFILFICYMFYLNHLLYAVVSFWISDSFFVFTFFTAVADNLWIRLIRG